MKISTIFAWYDLRVGFFWDSKKRWLYFFPIVMCGIILKFPVKYVQSKCDHVWEESTIFTKPRIIPPTIMRCTKCGMVMGGTDSYYDFERVAYEWKDTEKKEVVWKKGKDGVLRKYNSKDRRKDIFDFFNPNTP